MTAPARLGEPNRRTDEVAPLAALDGALPSWLVGDASGQAGSAFGVLGELPKALSGTLWLTLASLNQTTLKQHCFLKLFSWNC